MSYIPQTFVSKVALQMWRHTDVFCDIAINLRFNNMNYLYIYQSGLVVLTAAAGYAIAPGVFDPSVMAGTTIGTMLCSASANSFNQVNDM